MKTTLDLPDELMRSIKVKAAREDRKLKDVVADLLRKGIESQGGARSPQRVRLPLIECAHPAAPGEEATPERVAQLLEDEELEGLIGS